MTKRSLFESTSEEIEHHDKLPKRSKVATRHVAGHERSLLSRSIYTLLDEIKNDVYIHTLLSASIAVPCSTKRI